VLKENKKVALHLLIQHMVIHDSCGIQAR